MPTASPARCSARSTRWTGARTIQQAYNLEHGITPTSIVKSLEEVRLSTHVADARMDKPAPIEAGAHGAGATCTTRPSARRLIAALEQQMREAAANLEFELAALLRDQLNDLRPWARPNVRRDGGRRRQRSR